MKLARLRQPILTHGRIENQPDFVRATRHGLTEVALYLSELLHELRFGMKSPGGAHTAVSFAGFSDRLSHRRQQGTDGGHPEIGGEQRTLEFFVELRSDTSVRGQ